MARARTPATGEVGYDHQGVIKDFHYESLHQKLGPFNLRPGDFASLASFKIDAADSRSLISQIKSPEIMAPGMPFSYRFMSDSYNDMYRSSEQRAGTIAWCFRRWPS